MESGLAGWEIEDRKKKDERGSDRPPERAACVFGGANVPAPFPKGKGESVRLAERVPHLLWQRTEAFVLWFKCSSWSWWRSLRPFWACRPASSKHVGVIAQGIPRPLAPSKGCPTRLFEPPSPDARKQSGPANRTSSHLCWTCNHLPSIWGGRVGRGGCREAVGRYPSQKCRRRIKLGILW